MAAKEKASKAGRKRIMTDSKLKLAKKLLADGIPRNEIAKTLGVSIQTLYRWCPADNFVMDFLE